MPLISALRRQRQGNLCEFETSLVYRVSARIGSKATHRNSCLEKTTNQTNKQNKTYQKKSYTVVLSDYQCKVC